MAVAAVRPIARLIAPSRAGEWWEHKLLPILAISYATAWLLELPPIAWLLGALQLLGAIIPGAIFVSVINDLTDQEDDLAAGKPNRMARVALPARILLVALPVAIGIAWCVIWRDQPALLFPYLAAWLAFTCYSVPPLRLKHRGWAGALCDASGAHLFPALLAVGIAAGAADRPIAPLWTVAVGAAAFAYGLRGILLHQLGDRDNDHLAGARTVAVRLSPGILAGLARWAILPVELAALAILFAMLGAPLIWVALGLYLLSVAQRALIWKMPVILIVPQPRAIIFLAEFYAAWLPLALLLSLALREPVAGLFAIAIHLAIFPVIAWRTGKDLLRVEWVQLRLLKARARTGPTSSPREPN